MRFRRLSILGLLSLPWFPACASTAPSAMDAAEGLLPAPPSETVRASLGTIGVVGARHRTAESIEAAGWGAWAGAGALVGAARTVIGISRFFSAVEDDPSLESLAFRGFIMLVSAPVGALIGAFVGSVREGALAEADKAELRAAFREARAGMRIQETFRDRVREAAARQNSAAAIYRSILVHHTRTN